MKNIKVILIFLFLGAALTSNAQQATTASGGNAFGNGGSSSYSVGQIVYTTNVGSNGSMAQGVQQPYEISIVFGVEDNLINLNFNLYPNPTSNFLTLSISDIDLSVLSFELFGSDGKLIEAKKITTFNEVICLENLSSGAYFLKIINNYQQIKLFKIIKN
jgi:hypothetical protein